MNKRHYEHTLPNIRGSLSNTYKETAVHCNFVINKSIHTRMKFLAIKKNMSLKDIVNEAMKEYLEKNEQ